MPDMQRPELRSSAAPALPARDMEALEDLVRRIFGPRAEVAEHRVVGCRPDYFVLVARLLHPSMRITIKLAGPDAPIPCPFDRTAAILHLVSTQTATPVPEVLAVDVSYREWPWRYLVKTYVPGEEWASVRERMTRRELNAGHRQIGHAVAEMHTIRFKEFGELAVDGAGQSGSSYLLALSGRAKRRIKNAHHAELFVSLVEGRAHLFKDVDGAYLCHEDLHGHNILFNHEQGEWRLAAILDFDSAWAGNHESDLARLELWRAMVGPGFWEAYNERHNLPEMYLQRRPIHQLMWCLEYAAATAVHLADTKRVCAELGLPPIRDFA